MRLWVPRCGMDAAPATQTWTGPHGARQSNRKCPKDSGPVSSGTRDQGGGLGSRGVTRGLSGPEQSAQREGPSVPTPASGVLGSTGLHLGPLVHRTTLPPKPQQQSTLCLWPQCWARHSHGPWGPYRVTQMGSSLPRGVLAGARVRTSCDPPSVHTPRPVFGGESRDEDRVRGDLDDMV